MTSGKTIALTIWTFVSKVRTLLFNTLSWFVIVFLQGASVYEFHGCSHRPQWFWSPSKQNLSVSTFSPSICHEVMGPDAVILVSWLLSFKPAFSLSSFILIKRLFSSSSLFAISVVLSACLRFFIFLQQILILTCDSFSPAFCIMYSA